MSANPKDPFLNLFDELTRITKLNAYATTGDERHLKDMPPIPKFNEPTHLPQPLPTEPFPEFNVWDDDLMKDCIGGNLTKPVQALLQAYELQWEHYSKDDLRQLVKDLREAVKEEWRGL